MLDPVYALDQLIVQFGSLRAKRNTLLAQRQIISVLDTELTGLELRLGFMRGSEYSPEFYAQHTQMQADIAQTAKRWFH